MNSSEIIALNDCKSKVQMVHVNNEVGKNDLLKAVIAEIVTNIVDLVCRGCISFDYPFDRSNIVDPTSFRIDHSARNNDKFSESAFAVHSSSDSSDDEFDRILKSIRRQISLQRDEEDDDIEVAVSAKTNAKPVEHEYDIMPAIEELRIHVEEDILLEQFGRIVNIVDRLIVIEANSNIALDFDTVIFDAERNAVGRIFDIFGPVAKPMYAILFNDIKEANERRVGSAMYYAPAASQFTHAIFTEKLRQEKATDGCWDGEGECPDDMLAFSDDETEQRYKAKHRSLKVYRGQHMFDSPKNKKARYSSKRGRSKCRNRRHNITRQFRNGFEQYGGNAAGINFEQNSMQQSSLWSAAVNKNGFRRLQSDLRLTSLGIPECPNYSFFERNMDSRQQLSFHSLLKDEEMLHGVFPRTNEILLQNMNNLSAQHTTLNSSLNNL
ncbi:Gar1/Naf1 RNA binding region family protein [Acanthocheilonema viteae]